MIKLEPQEEREHIKIDQDKITQIIDIRERMRAEAHDDGESMEVNAAIEVCGQILMEFAAQIVGVDSAYSSLGQMGESVPMTKVVDHVAVMCGLTIKKSGLIIQEGNLVLKE